MEFLTKLTTQRGTAELRTFNHIWIPPNIKLSIQASMAHYCTPRVTRPSASYYERMELAIIKDGEFVNSSEVTKDEELNEKLERYFDGGIYKYVHVELIEKLYQELK